MSDELQAIPTEPAGIVDPDSPWASATEIDHDTQLPYSEETAHMAARATGALMAGASPVLDESSYEAGFQEGFRVSQETARKIDQMHEVIGELTALISSIDLSDPGKLLAQLLSGGK